MARGQPRAVSGPQPTPPQASSPPRRAAVLGSPVSHSLSPAMHRAAYAALGLTGWRYDAIEMTPERLADFLTPLDAEWVGVSLTMPLKRAVRRLLVEQSRLAGEVGAVNTAVRRDDGWHGYNTDVHGIVQALAEVGAHQVGDAVVIGGGATATSALAALRETGCHSSRVVVRSSARAVPLLEAAERLGVAVELVPFEPGPLARAVAGLASGSAVISTVPADVGDRLAAELRAALRPRAPAVGSGQGRLPVLLDVVYHPWPTPLASAWSSLSGRCANGLAMLAHQAEGQIRLMTGLRIDVDVLRRAGRAELARRAAVGE